MKLFLHIGTEKTGSSYLQSLAAQNRNSLLKDGIWFPFGGKLEHQMIQGQISDGNAQLLTDFINSGDYEGVLSFLQKVYSEGQTKGAKKVLLSNELLILALANDKNIEQIIQLAKKVGFNHVKWLLVIRDPIEQALSLYKHRAKSGNIPSVEEWIMKNYYYSTVLNNFFTAVQKIPIVIEVRKYMPSVKPLESIYFEEWLNCHQKIRITENRVNPSLTLSELSLIKKLKVYSAEGSVELYNRLLNLPKSEKAPVKELESHYRVIIGNYLQQYSETWELCNRFLKFEEHIDIPRKVKVSNSFIDAFQYSDKQLELIAEYVADWGTTKFRNKLLFRQVKRKLGRIKTKFSNSLKKNK